jgi:hypothetical protein
LKHFENSDNKDGSSFVFQSLLEESALYKKGGKKIQLKKLLKNLSFGCFVRERERAFKV